MCLYTLWMDIYYLAQHYHTRRIERVMIDWMCLLFQLSYCSEKRVPYLTIKYNVKCSSRYTLLGVTLKQHISLSSTLNVFHAILSEINTTTRHCHVLPSIQQHRSMCFSILHSLHVDGIVNHSISALPEVKFACCCREEPNWLCSWKNKKCFQILKRM